MLSRTTWESRPVRHRPPERGFKLSLPMTVEGPDPDGDFFHEETRLAFMSHQGALFPLRNPVALGSRPGDSVWRERFRRLAFCMATGQAACHFATVWRRLHGSGGAARRNLYRSGQTRLRAARQAVGVVPDQRRKARVKAGASA